MTTIRNAEFHRRSEDPGAGTGGRGATPSRSGEREMNVKGALTPEFLDVEVYERRAVLTLLRPPRGLHRRRYRRVGPRDPGSC